MKRYLTILLAIVASVCTLQASDVEYEFSEAGYSNQEVVTSGIIDDFSIWTADKGEGTVDPKYFTEGAALRVYAKGRFTVSSIKKISSISLTLGSGNKTHSFDQESFQSNVGNSFTWTDNANTSGHVKVQSISITYEPDAVCSGSCGEHLTWELDTITHTLNISGYGAMTDYTDDSPTNKAPWFYVNSLIYSVSLPDSLTTIGDYAFKGCSNLTAIALPDKLLEIGYYAFSGCSSLTSITIPDSVTLIESFAFSGCSGLTSITIPENVSNMGGRLFQNCSNLTAVIWNVIDCTLPSTYENAPFYGIRSNITSFTFGDKVTKIPQYLCDGLSNLTAITLPESVTTIEKCAFYGCSGLVSVNIPENVTNIGFRAFYNCRSLTSITIPENISTIDDEAFYNCSGLTSIVWNTKQYTDFSSAEQSVFYSVRTHIYTFTFGDNVENVPAYLCWGMYNLTSIVIPESTTSISNFAFSGCSNLTSVSIGENVTSIGNYAFNYCKSLTSVTIPENVTTLGNSAFRDCSGLTSISIPDNVTEIADNAFCNCSNLASVSFGQNVVSIGNSVFYGCGLSSVNVSNLKNWAEMEINSTNANLLNATLLVNGVQPTEITFPNGTDSICSGRFMNCSKLTKVIIPASTTRIGKSAFKNNPRLQEVVLGESIEAIADSAFANAPYLITIHAQMEFPPIIAASVFADCGDLSVIDCYVLQSSFAFYKKTAVWKEFNLIIETNTDIVDVPLDRSNRSKETQTVFVNGLLLILTPDGHTYNLFGLEVE